MRRGRSVRPKRERGGGGKENKVERIRLLRENWGKVRRQEERS